MPELNQYLRRYGPPLVSLLALTVLIVRSLNLIDIQVDWITVALFVVTVLAPYAQNLERISVGNIEMELRSEIDQAQTQVEESIDESDGEFDGPHPVGFHKRVNRIRSQLEEDPLLAVADLRSEIYGHLWMFADAEGIGDQHLPPRTLLQRLENDRVLEPDACNSIREVLHICNKAIHGGDINQDEASDLAELGVDIMFYLHSQFREQVVAPISTEIISGDEVDRYRTLQYEVKSVTPLVEDPTLQTRRLPQSGLDTMLEGYPQYGEFLVEIEPLDP